MWVVWYGCVCLVCVGVFEVVWCALRVARVWCVLFVLFVMYPLGVGHGVYVWFVVFGCVFCLAWLLHVV